MGMANIRCWWMSDRRMFSIPYLLYLLAKPTIKRAAWLPFFENTNVIIFLCPVSCFDEQLEEDHRVNRLEDSILLWRSICSSKLLTRTQLILFMNKCDLLKRKLKRGVQVSKYLTSYGDRANEVTTVVKCEFCAIRITWVFILFCRLAGEVQGDGEAPFT